MTQQTTQTTTQSIPSIHPDTDLGLLALIVGDLENSKSFYQEVMGFKLLRETEGRAVLGAGDKPLLVLEEEAGAPPAPTRATGLYHFAILLPSRDDLAHWLLHLVQSGYPLGGASDHLVSEALYLSDPEGNGIEVYRDRPREDWPRFNGSIQMATDPLDLRALLLEAQATPRPWNGLPEGTRLGHMHLQVADIPQARDFYHGVLGFDIVVDMERMGALFISAGGYHHHIGLNTWHSRGGRPRPDGYAGLGYFTVRLPDADALAPVLARLDTAGIPYREDKGGIATEDPWRNTIVFLTEPTSPDEA